MSTPIIGKLGKKEPRNDPRDLRLARYMVRAAPPKPPSTYEMSHVVKTWPMYGNDELGDCAIAAPAHEIEAWTYGTRVGRDLVLADVLKGYEAVGGYVPGDPSTDNGCVYGDVMGYWRATGFGGDRIAGYIALSPKDPGLVKRAIWLFGGVQLGLNLPLSARDQISAGKPWTSQSGPKGIPGSWGGHAVYLVDYTPYRATCVTWGGLQQMTWAFVRKYADEAFVALSVDWIDKATSKSPTGFDYQALELDLTQFSQP